ncbi:hypothetical protein FMM68_12615 [Lachnospiraceae bacterium MD329]|nr:hypothetical protein [Lachnospiraceae bacterium MD329]
MSNNLKQNILNTKQESEKNNSLLLMAEKFLNDDEEIITAIITDTKICDSFSPQKFNWKGAKNTLIIITKSRIILGQKNLLSKHFEEILPQFISKCYKRKLINIPSLCLTTKQASMAIALSDEHIEIVKNAILSIMDTISEYSQFVKGFPERDKYNRRRLTIYDTIITGVNKLHNGIDPQPYISELSSGDDILLIPDPYNRYDQSAIKVCTEEGVQIGWIPKGDDLDSLHFQQDVFYRLQNNYAVLAKVKEKYTTKSGDVGVIIDVARYALK